MKHTFRPFAVAAPGFQTRQRSIRVTGAAVTKPPGNKSGTCYMPNLRLQEPGGLLTAAPVTRMRRSSYPSLQAFPIDLSQTNRIITWSLYLTPKGELLCEDCINRHKK